RRFRDSRPMKSSLPKLPRSDAVSRAASVISSAARWPAFILEVSMSVPCSSLAGPAGFGFSCSVFSVLISQKLCRELYRKLCRREPVSDFDKVLDKVYDKVGFGSRVSPRRIKGSFFLGHLL